MKLDVVQSWFSERFPQDTMQAFVQSITAAGGGDEALGGSSSTSKSLYNMAVHGELRGLDRDQRLAYHERSVCLILSDTQLVVSSVRGQFRMKPNEVLHTIDRTGLISEWFDYEEMGNGFTNLILRIPDGTWIAGGVGTKVFGKEKAMATFATEFVEQLGATEIDWRNPPPL